MTVSLRLEGKKILYIAPKFFGYENEIKQVLMHDFGADVDFYDERPSNDFWTKVFIRLKLKSLLKYKIDSYYKSIFYDIKEKTYDYIFVISPETLSQKELVVIKNLQPHAQFILYMWDSFKNKNSLELIPIFHKILSFDFHDAQKYSLIFYPLFYSSMYSSGNSFCTTKYDLCSIATAHSDRYRLVQKIKHELKNKNLQLFSFMYLPSQIMYWIRKLFLKQYEYGNVSDFSFISMSSHDIASVMSQSHVILDINHPAQNGLTMRTFEALGLQKKIITTNKNIKDYDFYMEDNILIIDRDNPKIQEDFFTKPYTPLAQKVYEKYSLRSWIQFVFDCK